MLTEQMPEDYRVVNIYGVGGQGKTMLLQEFQSELRKRPRPLIPFASVDFSSPESRDVRSCLVKIRTQLRAYGFSSDIFDVAFARHFTLNNPGRNLKQDYPELYGTHDDLLGELAEITGTVFTELPGGKLVFDVLSRLSERYREWYSSSKPVLAEMEELGIQELRERLPNYLGYDICEFIAKDPPLRPLMFFDTYEALWHERGGLMFGPGDASADAWVRSLIESSPGALFVVSGRLKLRWSELDAAWGQIIQNCDISDLSDEEASEFLTRNHVSEHDLHSLMIKNAHGHPFSLNLQMKIYEKVRAKGSMPKAQDFPATQKEILDRFVDHLEAPLALVLRVLSLPEEIDEKLWSHLKHSLSIGASYSLSEVVEDVIFGATSNSEFVMHYLLRDHLRVDFARKDPGLLLKARLAIFDFNDQASSPDFARRASVGMTEQHPAMATMDKHLIEAASQLRAADPDRFANWCIGRLLEYESKGRSTRLRSVLLAQIRQQLKNRPTMNSALAAKLARLEIVSNPFARAGQELARALLEHSTSSEIVPDLREMAYHLSRTDVCSLLEGVTKLLDSHAPDGDEESLVAKLCAYNRLGDVERGTRALEQLLRAGDHNFTEFEWHILWAALAAPADLSARVLEKIDLQSLPRTLHLTLVLDVLSLSTRYDKVPLVLRWLFQNENPSEVLRAIGSDQCSPLPSDQALMLLAECLFDGGNVKDASRVLDCSLTSRTFADFVRMNAGWKKTSTVLRLAEDLMRKVELSEGPGKMNRAIKSFALRLRIDRALNIEDMNSSVLRDAQMMADEFVVSRPSYEVRLEDRRFQGPNDPYELKIELVVNERGEGFVFVNDPMFCWRTCDYLALIGNKLLFQDRRRGLVYFGMEVDPQLMNNLVAGFRILLVCMDEESGKPILGRYKHVYDWNEATFRELGGPEVA